MPAKKVLGGKWKEIWLILWVGDTNSGRMASLANPTMLSPLPKRLKLLANLPSKSKRKRQRMMGG